MAKHKKEIDEISLCLELIQPTFDKILRNMLDPRSTSMTKEEKERLRAMLIKKGSRHFERTPKKGKLKKTRPF